MINSAISKLTAGEDLTFAEAEQVVDEIMDGECSDVAISSFLTALSCKGATIDEITGCAKGMRIHCEKFLSDEPVLEIAGAGEEPEGMFNISTAAAFVCAAAGVPVAEHGERAVSDRYGAAEVLEALGAKLSVPSEVSERMLQEIGFCFLFSQNYHQSMKYVTPVRKDLPISTVFDILGPLTNPAGTTMQLMGVSRESEVEPLARVMVNLGVNRCMVVCGADKFDGISVSGPTKVCEYLGGKFSTKEFTPEQFGFSASKPAELIVGSPENNASLMHAVFTGEEKGAARTAVLLNAAAALRIARGISMEEGIQLAAGTIDSGAVEKKLNDFVRLSNGE